MEISRESFEERAQVGILAGNCGEAGAVDLYGLAYSLPLAGVALSRVLEIFSLFWVSVRYETLAPGYQNLRAIGS
jgi:hypothetical protein